MKTKILKILRNAEGYISGQSICNELSVSRTAVWKCINQLKEEGYEFDAVSNKGYRIVKYPDIMTAEEITSRLSGDEVVKEVVFFTETDSTNNQAKLAAEAGAADGCLYVTECQTGGRGRRGRKWDSPPGESIFMSLLLRPEVAPQNASMLTIVAAMAVARAVMEIVDEAGKESLVDEAGKAKTGRVAAEAGKAEAGLSCGIKWPNDLVINKKKVCGILTEMSAEMDVINYVVIGIGINVNNKSFPEEISEIAGSIMQEAGRKIARSQIIAGFAKHFTGYYETFLKTGDLSGLVEEYNRLSINKGRQVRIEAKDSFIGEALGIDETGALLVKKENGTVERVFSGEVSVRGLYGYV